jgi:hypothetical protein
VCRMTEHRYSIALEDVAFFFVTIDLYGWSAHGNVSVRA